jgi:hypothetical protein
MATFRWLHITDLHLGLKGVRWRLPDVQDHFFQDLEYLHDKCGPWDLVLFTGDLTQNGAAEQFAEIEQLFSSLWQHLRGLGSDPILLAVPGNHDLVRPDETLAKHIIEAYGKGADDRFWEDKSLPYRAALEAAFANYREWWTSTPWKGKVAIQSGTLPGDFSATIEKEDVRLGIVGLNTTFLQLLGGDMTGSLALDLRQFHEACGGNGPDWTRKHHTCLLMTHQPPNWLTTEAQEIYKEIVSPPRFAVHLFGHMHESVIRTESYGGGDPRRSWQGNSFFSIEPLAAATGGTLERRHGYSAGRIEIDGGPEARLRHWPRRLRKHPHRAGNGSSSRTTSRAR